MCFFLRTLCFGIFPLVFLGVGNRPGRANALCRGPLCDHCQPRLGRRSEAGTGGCAGPLLPRAGLWRTADVPPAAGPLPGRPPHRLSEWRWHTGAPTHMQPTCTSFLSVKPRSHTSSFLDLLKIWRFLIFFATSPSEIGAVHRTRQEGWGVGV